MENAVIIPTYNEAVNISRLIRTILKLPEEIRIIVVDDNSPDGTGDEAEELARQHPGFVQVLHRPRKSGLGTAHIDGMKAALRDGEVKKIVTMDADFSHDPRTIPDLLRGAERGDVAIGSRYVPGGRTELFALHRRFISQGANLFARFMLRLTSNDNTSGFRCYNRHVLERIDLDGLFSPGYSFLVELLTRCHRSGFRIVEVPIVYVARAHGLSKISTREILGSVYTIFRLSLGPRRGTDR